MTSDIDLSFTDVLEELDGAATSYVRVFKGPYSFLLDTSFLQVAGQVDAEAGTVVPLTGALETPRGPRPFTVNVPVNVEAEADYKITQYLIEGLAIRSGATGLLPDLLNQH